MSTIDYTVTPACPAAHRFDVDMRAEVAPSQPLTLRLPTWIPGSYVIRDFARHLLSIEAESDGEPVAVTAIEGSAWVCTPTGSRLTVRCRFYARDESVRAAFLDDTRGFFNFTSLAVRPVGQEARECRVCLAPPPADTPWRVETSLEPVDVDIRGFGDYRAADYWDLIDQPVAMGAAIERVAFTVREVPHAFVLLGAHDADTGQLASDLARVCAAQADVFDALPARDYRFLAQVTPAGFGGLEHRDSSVLQVARDALPCVTDGSERREAYETLLGLCSHEYFHLWNVKRIRPAAVADSDLAGEAYFRDLWAYEGVTSYYDDLGLVRAGVLSEAAYLDRLAKLATRIERTPGRQVQSLADSSFDAWLKFYRPDENTPNAVVSYYGKGAQFALALDLKLRVETDEAVCLDDVMRRAWQDYGQYDRPVPEHGLAALAGEMSGLDLTGFVADYIETPAAVPWDRWLGAFGIRAVRAPADDDAAVLLGRLGLRLTGNGLPRVSHVFDDGPAQQAGLSPGDRLLALDGLEVGIGGLAGRLRRYPEGAQLRMHLFRADALLVREVVPAAAAAPEWHLSIDARADAVAHARRARWLDHDQPSA